MIYTGLGTEDPKEIRMGNYPVQKVFVGDKLVWPSRINGLDPNGHDFVDMEEAGIWATCNIGATYPEEIGQYFAWGDTVGYYSNQNHEFSGRTYKFASEYDGFTSSYRLLKVSKYCQSEYNGMIDGLSVLEPEDDAAHVNWGGDWRMPTINDFYKLITLCRITRTANGNYKFTLLSNSNKSIIIPSAKAYSIEGGGLAWGLLHSSQYMLWNYIQPVLLEFDYSNQITIGNMYTNISRVGGLNIRPILAKPIDSSQTITITAKAEGNGSLTELTPTVNYINRSIIQYKTIPGFFGYNNTTNYYDSSAVYFRVNKTPSRVVVEGDCTYKHDDIYLYIYSANSDVNVTFYFS